MTKSTFITLGACAIASIAVLRIKNGLKGLKNAEWTGDILHYQNTVEMFV